MAARIIRSRRHPTILSRRGPILEVFLHLPRSNGFPWGGWKYSYRPATPINQSCALQRLRDRRSGCLSFFTSQSALEKEWWTKFHLKSIANMSFPLDGKTIFSSIAQHNKSNHGREFIILKSKGNHVVVCSIAFPLKKSLISSGKGLLYGCFFLDGKTAKRICV